MVVLTGCGTSERESAPLTAPATTAESTSPTASGEDSSGGRPELPDAARQRSVSAAEAFTRHWIDAFNFAGASGDVSALEDLDTNKCGSCRAVLRRIRTIYDSGGSYTTAGWKVTALGPRPDTDLRAPVLTGRIAVPRERYVYESPREVETLAADRITLSFDLRWQSSRWLMNEITDVD